jgi:hypothetical protein
LSLLQNVRKKVVHVRAGIVVGNTDVGEAIKAFSFLISVQGGPAGGDADPFAKSVFGEIVLRLLDRS